MRERTKVNGSGGEEGAASELSVTDGTDGVTPLPRRPPGASHIIQRADCRGRAVRRALLARRRAVDTSRLPLREFVRQSWRILEPFTPFVDNWHIGLICEYLEAVSAGELLRLVINVPPRHMKSILVTVDFPAWEWTFNPSLKFFCGSYVAALSTQHSVACRRLIESEWYRKRWGHICSLMPDQNEKTRYETTALGSRLAVQVGTGTGASADRVILDDPNNADEVESDAAREKTIDWFRSTASQRLNDAKRSAIVIVMQRLHERDLCGYVLGELGGFTHLCLPAEYEPPRFVQVQSRADVSTSTGEATEKIEPADVPGIRSEQEASPLDRTDASAAAPDSPLEPTPSEAAAGTETTTLISSPAASGVGINAVRLPESIKHSDPRTERGELLWPGRWNREYVELQKRTLGSYRAAGQLQQRPSPAEGGILKRRWWRFWRQPRESYPPVLLRLEDGTFLELEASPLPESLANYLQSWDLAFKDTASSAYVVGQVWAKKGADCFLLDQAREKLDFPETLKAIERMTAKWPNCKVKLVEDKANGPAVIATLKSKISGLIPVEPGGSKEARAHAVSPFIESGNVYLPHPGSARWVAELIEEATAFPNGAYADQVDAMTQALNRLMATDDDDGHYETGLLVSRLCWGDVLAARRAAYGGGPRVGGGSLERHLLKAEKQCHKCQRTYTEAEDAIWECPNCHSKRWLSGAGPINV
ncbi:MAG TPA: phage terminase large subunit [Blastocatellia bacterium]|nr:phage terminase large subunit [Blastocatellia bacterium]